MGAATTAFEKQWDSAELDDDWCLEEECRPEEIRDVQAVEHTLGAGWSLAQETPSVVPAVSMNRSLVNPLSDAEVEEFSRADIGMGTGVDMLAPKDVWFEELRCIVPRKRAPSVSEMSCAPAEPEPEVCMETATQQEHSPPTAKKARWWKRLRR
ncbi:MAG: hypothetical protein GY811_03625 [Myxococcales bacterium]|nr:hypothetical protein [Myxococcales bacterium]